MPFLKSVPAEVVREEGLDWFLGGNEVDNHLDMVSPGRNLRFERVCHLY